jgi:hypothetical protein
MENEEKLIGFTKEAKMLLKAGYDSVYILNYLKHKGANQKELENTETYLRKLRDKKRTKNGSLLVLLGVITLGIGFLSCIIMHYCGSNIDIALYGITSIGVIILIIGLMLIFH